MNIHLVAADIVSRLGALKEDSTLNSASVIEGILKEAIERQKKEQSMWVVALILSKQGDSEARSPTHVVVSETIKQAVGWRYNFSRDEAIGSVIQYQLLENPGWGVRDVVAIQIQT